MNMPVRVPYCKTELLLGWLRQAGLVGGIVDNNPDDWTLNTRKMSGDSGQSEPEQELWQGGMHWAPAATRSVKNRLISQLLAWLPWVNRYHCFANDVKITSAASLLLWVVFIQWWARIVSIELAEMKSHVMFWLYRTPQDCVQCFVTADRSCFSSRFTV